MIFYFEFCYNDEELKKFEITTNTNNGRLLLEAIESPCNDRKVIATGDTVAELEKCIELLSEEANKLITYGEFIELLKLQLEVQKELYRLECERS